RYWTIKAGEIACRFGERRRGRRQADSLHLRRQPTQAFEAERQIGAALARSERMDLVDDDPAQAVKESLSLWFTEQDREALRSRQQHVGRIVHEQTSFLRRRIAGSDGETRTACIRREKGRDLLDVARQIAARVVAERLERSDVDTGQGRSTMPR